MSASRPSVIVRSKNKEATIERTLRSIREQTVEAEIVLVDSGSTDRTLEIARPYCDHVVTIPAAAFSYGGALNLGAERGSGEILFALSAHCAPENNRWIEWSLEAYSDPGVAGTVGAARSPAGRDLDAPVTVELHDLTADPFWGFSNHASSWRRRDWERQHFNDRLVACEDKEWMWRVLAEGRRVVADPRLVVDTGHRRRAGLRPLFTRVYREHLVLSELLDYPPMGLADLANRWWSDFPWDSPRPRWQRRLSPWRAVELIAEYAGDRRGAPRRGAQTIRLASWASPASSER
jgi:rhamnosyltransferase